MTRSSALLSRRQRRSLIPWAFVAGFAVVIAANAALIWFAVESFSGLAESHPYQTGLAYNRTLAAARAQEALGWKADLAVQPAGQAGAVQVTLSLVDRTGAAIEEARIAAEFIRPVTTGQDRAATLAPSGAGRYEAAVPLNLPGQWEIRIKAQRAGEQWQMTQRVQLP